MECSIVFLRRGGRSVCASSPSTIARAMPLRAAEVKTSRYVPFRATTAGARSAPLPFVPRTASKT